VIHECNAVAAAAAVAAVAAGLLHSFHVVSSIGRKDLSSCQNSPVTHQPSLVERLHCGFANSSCRYIHSFTAELSPRNPLPT
jgi:hypothetical protein